MSSSTTITEKSNLLAEIEVSYKTKIKPSDRVKITGAYVAHSILKDLYDPNRIEHLEESIILCVDRAGKMLGWCKISTGGVAGTVVDPKVIFQIALNCNASSIIISHNHPSGNLVVSAEDIKITKKLVEGGKLLDIVVSDHLIITSEGYYSFAEEGLI